jgi:hypothetical protein
MPLSGTPPRAGPTIAAGLLLLLLASVGSTAAIAGPHPVGAAAALPPTAPRNLTADPGDSQVTLRWQPPADDGGSPVAEYIVYRGTKPGLGFNSWNRTGNASSPEARYRSTLVYDPLNRRSILFGGDTNGYFGDTWLLDSAAKTWTEMKPTAAPAPRNSHSMVFDTANGKGLLFGGWDNTNLGDTWAYDAAANRWTPLNPPSSPGPRNSHAMAYDASQKKIVLFGGCAESACPDSETWIYDPAGNAWSRASPSTSPGPRWIHKMAYDADAGKVVLFGGVDRVSPLGDTWTYDVASNTWTNMSPPSSPRPRTEFSMTYDEANKVVVLFGGAGTGQGYEGDTWTYDARANNWTNRTPSTTPGPRCCQAMAFDSALGRSIMFGWNLPPGGGPAWTYDAGTNRWEYLSPAAGPTPRALHSMALDPARRKAVMFGGDAAHPETWVYDLATSRWSLRSPAISPGPRERAAMVFDEKKGVAVMFGGWDGNDTVNETWLYDLGADTWTLASPVRSPAGRYGHAMAYDPWSEDVVLFGGSGRFTALNDTWTFDAATSTWSDVSPALSPPARAHHAMSAATGDGKLVMFGSGSDYETWVYDVAANEWSDRRPASVPKSRTGHAMVFDASRRMALMLGGYVSNAYDPAIRSYDAAKNFWGVVAASPAPSGRTGHSLAYDRFGATLLLFGGFDGGRDGETWEFPTAVPHAVIRNATKFEDTGLANGAVYYYRVAARSAAGLGAPTIEVSARPRTVPDAPTGLKATASVRQVMLAWEPPADDGGARVADYTVYGGLAPDPQTEVGRVWTPGFFHQGLAPRKTYHYRVAAVNEAGEGPKSLEVQAEVSGSPPSAPLNLTAIAWYNQVNLSWDPPDYDGGWPVERYLLFRSEPGHSSREVANTTLVAVLDTGLAAQRPYTYFVVAVNHLGKGMSSGQVTATPLVDPAWENRLPIDYSLVYLGATALLALVAFVVVERLLSRRRCPGRTPPAPTSPSGGPDPPVEPGHSSRGAGHTTPQSRPPPGSAAPSAKPGKSL